MTDARATVSTRTSDAPGPVPRTTATAGPRKPAGRAARGSMLRSVALWRVVTLVVLIGGWQLGSGVIVDSLLVSSPSRVVSEIGRLFGSGEIWPHLKATYSEVAIGYSLAACLGVTFGIILGRSRFLAKVFEPYIMAAYSIPKIALAPLFILWLGIGANSKIGVSFLSAVFLIFYATFTGTKNMNEELVTMARLLGARQWELVRKVYLPLTMPFILDGLRAGIPFAVIGAVVGEFMASNVGLGFFILRASSNLDATGTFAGIIVLVAGVSLLNFVLQLLELRFMRWKPRLGRDGTP